MARGFYINLPIGVAILWATWRYLDESPRQEGAFDVLGAVLSTLSMSPLVFGLVRSAQLEWPDITTRCALACGAVLGYAFVRHEANAAQPIMPLHLFANRTRCAAYGARVLFLGAMMGFWFFITQYLQSVPGFTALMTGIALLPLTVSNFVVAVCLPLMIRRFVSGPVLAAGLTVALAGMSWLSFIRADSTYSVSVALPLLLVGMGQAAALSPLAIAGVSGVRPENAGEASGMVNAAHQLGGSLGVAELVNVYAAASGNGTPTRSSVTHQFSAALTVAAALLAAALANRAGVHPAASPVWIPWPSAHVTCPLQSSPGRAIPECVDQQ